MTVEALSDLELLILTIIGEARGEPIEGQVGVACVIRNRVLTYNRSYSAICLAPKQFSCWNDNDPNRVLLEELGKQLINGNKLDQRFSQCQWVAVGIMRNQILDNTHGSLNYMT